MTHRSRCKDRFAMKKYRVQVRIQRISYDIVELDVWATNIKGARKISRNKLINEYIPKGSLPKLIQRGKPKLSPRWTALHSIERLSPRLKPINPGKMGGFNGEYEARGEPRK